jgi:hypothetical protein
MSLHPAKCITVALLAASCAAHADLQDEIQVYDDAINAPREAGLELHVNTTPRGRSLAAYPGEATPARGIRITPELAYGLTRTLEAGLYLPTEVDARHRFSVAGIKLRLKWLPLQTVDERGAFAGLNLELSRLALRYSESRSSAELRFIAGWRNADWLLAVNPTLGFGLSDGQQSQRPGFRAGFKVARQWTQGLAGGLEYYTDPGAVGRRLPWQQQDNRLFAALDVDAKPWVFNLAVGRGLTDAADRWTVKAIFEIPLDRFFK